MRGAKRVVVAFSALREAAQAAHLAQAGHAVTPSGQDFVRVGLVAHVPDDAVVGRVVDIVQCNSQLDRAEIGAEVAAGLGHTVQQKTAQLVSQVPQLVAGQLAQVRRIVNAVQQRVLKLGHMLLF